MEIDSEDKTLEEELDDEENNNNDNGDQLQNPKPQNPKLRSDSDSDSDSEDESQQNQELKTLETELSSNPSNYDSHTQYIKLLRKMGEIDKLKQAREAMNNVFPLSPDMWRDWAKDEASISGPEGFAGVEKIYDRGVFDYLSVSLWCDYLNYIQEHDPSVRECSPDGISKARNLFERALTAAGLHVAEGNKIWELYREFEQVVLHTIDENDIKAKELQVQRIRNIFHRQLSVPLVNLRSTLLAYKAWEVEQGIDLDAKSSEVDGIPSHLASAYQKAMEAYNARAQHEEQISMQNISDTEKFQNFMNYLKFEKSVGDPARVQVLYERALADFPISSDLWLDYTRYLDRTLKVGNVLRDVYSRATKNCPWIGELWVQYMLSLERGRAPEKEISSVFEKSLQCIFSTIEEYLDLFLTRVHGLRRRIECGGEVNGVLDFALIRETFQHASDYLSPHLKNTDGLLQLYAYWGRLEMNLGKDLVAARRVWESLLKISGSMLEAWQGFIAMETESGHISEARSIYKRCYSKRFPGTGSEDICHSWLRFEEEFGTLEDFDHAIQKVTPRLEELKLYRIQQETKASTDQSEVSGKKIAREKRKGGSTASDKESPAKRQKQTAQTQKKGYEDKDQLQKYEVNEAQEAKIDLEKTDSAPDEKQMKGSDVVRTKGYTDQCTVFISNIHFKANSEDIRKFFSDVGGVASIRILHDRNTGKSRGLAYVDFVDDEHLAAAITKNKQMLFGKRLSIARSDPKQNRRDGRRVPREQAFASDRRRHNWESASKEYVDTHNASGSQEAPQTATLKSDDNIQFKGKNIFAVPRNVRTLGLSANKSKTVEEGHEKPKSNDEFRKMFIKE
ncbi:PREDICTED: squamous cell carcinoma antigen recognized by T-cells 3-like [Populus euphratica]|uniref:Squamous cell carcinoma antigen recognized by T-cells 3-like n=1 Tax=Populus euphratica TaxID=75702 RepID=A0AAJ6XRB7_POPEU|nr:PREDICTED: squamous cell carcinoma antigen recognized by T-cells 3-like [Populus euphratica]XP_011028422.1 PREDICTED: squamous cell carcinoma antigen recognized by T-cells 3-like [Populus euphratica]